MKINLNDIKLSPDFDSVYREKMSDERYFSTEFSDYISNSRLKLINPLQNGSPSQYKAGFTGEKTISLDKGSNIHLGILQPEEFKLGPDINKPSAKLGLVIDGIYDYRRKRNYSIYSSILYACKEIHYYENSLSLSRIKQIIKGGFLYYWNRYKLNNDSLIFLSNNDRKVVLDCIDNVRTNKIAQRILYPTDLFGDPILYYNEDAFFININGKYKDKSCILKLKMKADNWSIDPENKVITLNDLKTTGHKIDDFMNNSFITFHYSRQCAMYMWILLQYVTKEYGYNKEEWTVKCNIIAVETILNHRSQVFPISKNILEKGRKEFCRLLKMVAYCEMNDYSDDIIFI